MDDRTASPAARLNEVARALAGLDDVLAGRVGSGAAPAWCETRGWTAFLAGLSDEALARCEREGLDAVLVADRALAAAAPADLRALAARAAALEAWARGPAREAAPAPTPLRRASPRKQAQVAALVALCRAHLPPPRRVVDAGAGLGHLTRELARALGAQAVGLERERARVEAARALTGRGGPSFEQREVDAALRFAPGDLVVGLHACGALGDALVEAVARDGAALALVCCCLQKVSGPVRLPCSSAGRALGLAFSRDVLGLANLSRGREAIELPLVDVLAGREVRHALRLLLAARGVELRQGDEMRGLHRRWVQRGLAPLAERALARRGLAPATAAELAEARARAAVEHGAIRRFSLPRALLGRLLELAVVLDRACALEEAGRTARVLPAFGLALSPRNLAVVAS